MRRKAYGYTSTTNMHPENLSAMGIHEQERSIDSTLFNYLNHLLVVRELNPPSIGLR